MVQSRTQKAKKNIVIGLLVQILLVAFTFITRTIFINILGIEILGVSNVFASVLTILSIAELGIGEAIAFALYKPLAEEDNDKIRALMFLFKRTYTVVAFVILFLGLCLLPFLKYIVKDSINIQNIYLIYGLYLTNTVCSYFYSYKRILLIADQKKYVDTVVHFIFLCVMYILQIIFLLIYKSFIVYLLIQMLSTFLENGCLSLYVNKNYSFLKDKNFTKLNKEDKEKIYKNFFALAIQRLNGVIAQSIDNIVLSIMLGTIIVARYSNYMTIEKYLTQFLLVIYTAISGSVGNLIASESKEKQYDLFKKINYITFWIFSITAICYFVIVQPFIMLWLKDSQYQIDLLAVFFITINYYLLGVRQSVTVFKNAYGLYWQDRYKPIVAAVLNIITSILFTYFFGVAGVAMGTAFTYLFVNTIVEPYVLYKHGFNRNVKEYYFDYIIKLVTVIVCMLLFYLLMQKIQIESYFVICILSGGIVLLVYNLFFFLFSFKKPEFKYFKDIVKGIILKRKKS